jgi:hypothetical protein
VTPMKNASEADDKTASNPPVLYRRAQAERALSPMRPRSSMANGCVERRPENDGAAISVGGLVPVRTTEEVSLSGVKHPRSGEDQNARTTLR